MVAEFDQKSWDHRPDNDILTPEGCRKLLHIGEKGLTSLMTKGLPYVAISNSYRFVRSEVIAWMADEGRKQKSQLPD